MASDADFVTYACGQIRNVPGISHRKMFGEYAVYAGDKVVALICDNQFFLKPTPGNRALLGTPTEAPPYPGAKNYYVLADELDDPHLMARLISVTEAETPAPKAKKKGPGPGRGPKAK
ncbi:MAG TPA: TfoX/Sxy family protein [Longimicrobiales bacterium]